MTYLVCSRKTRQPDKYFTRKYLLQPDQSFVANLFQPLKKFGFIFRQSKSKSVDQTSKYSSPTSQPAKINLLQIYSSLWKKKLSIIKKSKYLDWRTSNVKGIKSRVTVNCSLPLALIKSSHYHWEWVYLLILSFWSIISSLLDNTNK